MTRGESFEDRALRQNGGDRGKAREAAERQAARFDGYAEAATDDQARSEWAQRLAGQWRDAARKLAAADPQPRLW